MSQPPADEEERAERRAPLAARLRGALPIAGWLRGYRPEWLRADAVAGVTLAAYAVPVSLAYATIAGLPPERGLYGYLFAGAVYCLFGTSRQLALGPTSAISLVIGTAIAEHAGGDAARAAAIGSLAALLVGAIAVAAWLLRLGSVVSFVSETVLAGFKVGAALVIASTQLPKLFGLAAQGDGFFARMAHLAHDLPATHPWALAVGGGALVLILLGERFLPNRPVVLGVVALSIVVTALFDLEGRGVRVVGALPGGVPVPSWPPIGVRDVDGLLVVALACFLLAYVEGSSVARTFALRNRYRVDPDQELLALGASNLAVGLGHGYPVAGGMSQSAVNAAAGARTPLALAAASVVIAAILLFATGLTRQLPEPLLAAVVLGAVRGLFDPAELAFLWRASRPEFRVALVALAGVLTLGVLRGVVVASILSLVSLIRRAERPPMAVLGRIAGTDRFRNLENHPEAERIPGVLVFRVEGGLVYFNVENVREELLRRVEESADPVRLVVFELAAVPHVDLAGSRLLATLRDELAARRARLVLAEARRSVRETLRRTGVDQDLGPLDRRWSIAELVDRQAPPQGGGA
jgi:high affinity sulfate transporter 1